MFLSFSETQGHIFAAGSHVASLALLLIHHYPTNIYLLGTKDNAKSIPQWSSILGRDRKSKQLKKHCYKMEWYILSTTDHSDPQVWGWIGVGRESG